MDFTTINGIPVRKAETNLNIESTPISTEKQMVEELQSMSETLTAALRDIDSESHNAASAAFDKIDEFNKIVKMLKGLTIYFNK